MSRRPSTKQSWAPKNTPARGASELDQGVGLADIDSGLGIKVVIAKIFPDQQQHSGQQKEKQLLGL